jgi:membrane-associated protein
VTPFLPGDSLLFALGTIAALGALDPLILIGILIIAAIAGDTINYWIGRYLGRSIIHSKRIPFFRKEYFDRAHGFYERHGGKTIILARFIPIIRTYTPFVAGVGAMNYKKFLFYDIIGGIVWVTLFIGGGYFFGNIPFIKNNFFFVIIAIIFISIMPGVIEFVRMRYCTAKQ